MERDVQGEECAKRLDGLRTVAALRADHLIDDRARNQPDQQEYCDSDAQERRQQGQHAEDDVTTHATLYLPCSSDQRSPDERCGNQSYSETVRNP
jgi:hypothetical protein